MKDMIIKWGLSAMLAFFLLVFALASIALIAARPKRASEAVKNADVSWLLEETDLGKIIVDEINASEMISANIDIVTVNRFAKRDNVSAAVGNVAQRYAEAIAGGDYDYYLNLDDVADFIKTVAPDISEEFGVRMTETDLDAIVDTISRYINLDDYTIGAILSDTGIDASVPYILLSAYPLIIVIVLVVLIVFDIFWLYRKMIKNAFLCSGIPLVLAGLLCFISGMLLAPYSSLFRSGESNGVMNLMSAVAELLFLPAAICLVIGLVSLAVFAIMRKITIKKEGYILRYVLKDSKESSIIAWRIAGIITNASLLIACIALLVVFSLNAP